MTTRWFGARVQRMEDDRLLRGRGRFTDDIDDGAATAGTELAEPAAPCPSPCR